MKVHRFVSPLAGVALATLPAFGLPSLASSVDELEQRLARLVEQLEDQRETSHVPGMALAVVVDGETVLTHGFGWADVENKLPVKPETLFAAGSTTKAFTAAAVAMLVEEAKLNWDDAVVDYLDYFDPVVDSPDPEAQVTLRDLLSHRSGFGRMGLLWGGGPDMPGERLLRVAAGAEPMGAFRKEFHYSNMMYLAAGQAAGSVAGDGWEQLVNTRILHPLGMDASSLSKKLAEADERLAKGYLWDADKEEFEFSPMLDIDRIGPAGSLNSNVIDMAKWVRWQLAQGQVDGERLLAERYFEEMWEPQISVAPGMEYGLGWFLQDRDGQRVIEHGGNIDGYSAQVAFLPEHGMGYAMLFNVSQTTLQQGSIGIFLDAMFGDLVEEEVEAGEYDAYFGTYHATFAQFDATPFEVLEQNGRLAVDIPGQTIFELKAPDDEGRWVFALTDQIAVSFVRNEQGDVTGMKMHQGGLTFDIPKEGFEAEELTEEKLQEKFAEFLGEYEANFGPFENATFEVRIKGQQLAVDVPGQTLYALNEPGDDGRWVFTATDEIAVSFQRTEGNGPVEALVMHQAGQDFAMPRRASATDLPSPGEIAELRQVTARMQKLRSLSGVRATGKIWVGGSGLEGEFTQWTEGAGKFATEMDFGDFGCVLVALSEDYAAHFQTLRGLDIQEGLDLEETRLSHPWILQGDWSLFFDSVTVLGRESWDDRDVFKIRLRKGEQEMLQWIDVESGLTYKQTYKIKEDTVTIPVTITLSDYRGEGPVPLAHKVEISNPFTGSMEITITEIDTGLEIDDELFRLEEGESRLSR